MRVRCVLLAADNIQNLCWAALGLQRSTLLGASYRSPEQRRVKYLYRIKYIPVQLGAHLHLMLEDMGDHPVMIALPPGPRVHGRSSPATPIDVKSPMLNWDPGSHCCRLVCRAVSVKADAGDGKLGVEGAADAKQPEAPEPRRVQ
jgi:hypothetical protein